MRPYGVVLAALSLMLSTEALAASAQTTADCPGDPEIGHDIELKIEIPEARLHHNLSIAQLGASVLHGPRSRVLGLANVRLEFGWSVGFEWRSWGDGFCFWVRRTVLTIRHPSPDIYIAREYRRGTCPYRTILGHERRHIRISKELIDRYIPRLRWVLTSLRIPTGARPVFVSSAENAKPEISALMKELAEPLFQEMGKALRETQAKIDTATNYRRLRKICRNW
jgi:hypothetical protein